MTKIKLRKILYPAFLLAYAVAVGLPIIYSVQFLSKAINSAFIIDEAKIEAQLIQLDVDGLKLIAPKLGIDAKSL